ncbi:MAG: LysR family transcriptional regulator [Hyphomicrobiales bacterium]|nr:LysR family transcriptional regulator [Hyphomicrobiales bacterium]MCC2108135.1 LysR family transcriptional regulator [Hyphomicrobiales bacterium]
MDLRHLEQIAAICRAGSFSGAARELGVAQPTLSKSIARLEANLGVRLFERTNAKALPTVYGRFVAEQAHSLLQNVDSLGRTLEQMARGERGLLRIGVGPATRLRPLPRLVERLAEAYPNLKIVVRYAGPRLMLRALRAGRFDVVFCNRELVPEDDDLIRVKLFEDRYITVVRRAHPALARAPLTARELMRLPLASAGLTPDFVGWLGPPDDAGARNLEAFQADDYDLIRRMPLCGDHVARGPRFVFEEDLRSGALVELPLESPFRYECWMLTTPGHWRSPIVKAVAQFSKARVRAD